MSKVYAISNEAMIGPAHGPYSQSLVCDGFFFTGMIGSYGADGILAGTVYEQTKQIFENTKTLLEQAGGTLADIIKVTVYLLNISDFDEMNRAYKEYINVKPLPARATVAVHEMLEDVKVEMEIVAKIS